MVVKPEIASRRSETLSSVGSTRLYIASLVAVVAVACAGPPTASPGNVQRLNYVAMGDSVAAAPGVPDPAPPAGCRKSTNDYPSVLARRLAATTFTDVTCSGATTENITSRAQQTKDGLIPRQIHAVEATTDLVTITVGANDVGLVPDAQECKVISPNSPPCTNEFVVGDADHISEVITAQLPVWSALIDEVRAKAPHARIIVVGYGIFVRPGGCFPGSRSCRATPIICSPNSMNSTTGSSNSPPSRESTISTHVRCRAATTYALPPAIGISRALRPLVQLFPCTPMLLVPRRWEMRSPVMSGGPFCGAKRVHHTSEIVASV